ncbi:unnamed protein product [Arctogadus glacialis]
MVVVVEVTTTTTMAQKNPTPQTPQSLCNSRQSLQKQQMMMMEAGSTAPGSSPRVWICLSPQVSSDVMEAGSTAPGSAQGLDLPQPSGQL